MFAVCVGVYPLMVLPMVTSLGELEAWGKKVAICTIVGSAMLVACYVKTLGTLNVVNGAICVGVFAGLAPAISAFRLLEANAVSMMILVLFSLTCSVVGLIYTDNYAQDLVCLSKDWAHI